MNKHKNECRVEKSHMNWSIRMQMMKAHWHQYKSNKFCVLALLLFRFVDGLTGDAPFLKLWRWNQTGRTANGVMSGLPPMMVVFAYNLQK